MNFESVANILRSKKILALFLVLLVFVAATISILKNNNTPKAVVTDDSFIINSISKLILIPDEQPIIATVSQKDVSKDQSFYLGSKVGDKIVIFPKAQEAILYRPDSNLIINVAPFTINSDVKK